MSYADLNRRLQRGDIILLDGGTGTELERRGVSMDPHAWCGPASLANAGLLETIHCDYIAARAEFFRMPEWRFVDVIPPAELQQFAAGWLAPEFSSRAGVAGCHPNILPHSRRSG